MSGWENKKERNEPKKKKKKSFLAKDESGAGVRATPLLLQSNALNIFLLAGSSTDDLEQRRET